MIDTAELYWLLPNPNTLKSKSWLIYFNIDQQVYFQAKKRSINGSTFLKIEWDNLNREKTLVKVEFDFKLGQLLRPIKNNWLT